MSGIFSLEHVQVHFSIFQYQLIGLQVWHRSNVFPIEFDYSSHQQFDEIHTSSKNYRGHKIRATYLVTFVSLERYRCSVASDWMLALAFQILTNQNSVPIRTVLFYLRPSTLDRVRKRDFGHGVHAVLKSMVLSVNTCVYRKYELVIFETSKKDMYDNDRSGLWIQTI